MLRRLPTTLLVCLALAMSAAMLGNAWAAHSEGSPEKLLIASPVAAQGLTAGVTPKPIVKVKPAAIYPTCPYGYVRPDVRKVKPAYMIPYGAAVQPVECYLPTAQTGQWDMSAGILFARLRGKIAWPRYSSLAWGGYWGGQTEDTDFTNGLQLPAHLVVPTWSVTYQFRPTWGVRYSGLAFQASGGGQTSDAIRFGTWQQSYGYGQGVQSKYQHAYHRVGIVYDALKTCKSTVRLFADWVHAEDRIESSSCVNCGQSTVFSKTTDAAMAGIEYQKCVKRTSNGATFSWDCRAGAIFLDDVEGWDVQGGARYTISLNSGRSGYLKGGYRLVELKKSQNDYLLKHALEGGFMELGFIF